MAVNVFKLIAQRSDDGCADVCVDDDDDDDDESDDVVDDEPLSMPNGSYYSTFSKWIEVICQSGWYQSIGGF